MESYSIYLFFFGRALLGGLASLALCALEIYPLDCIKSLLLSVAEYYSIAWLCHHLLLHVLLIDGYLGCFSGLGHYEGSCRNIHIEVVVWTCFHIS